MLFLQLHARLQQRCEPRTLRPLQTALAASLPRLLLTEALSPWRLLQVCGWLGAEPTPTVIDTGGIPRQINHP